MQWYVISSFQQNRETVLREQDPSEWQEDSEKEHIGKLNKTIQNTSTTRVYDIELHFTKLVS